jgi:hypothetical protein
VIIVTLEDYRNKNRGRTVMGMKEKRVVDVDGSYRQRRSSSGHQERRGKTKSERAETTSPRGALDTM